MKKYLFLTIAVLLAAAVALADSPNRETLATADGGVSLTSGWSEVGPNGVDAAADGSATLVFFWFAENDRETVVKTSATFNLRADFGPRYFSFSGGPDSVYVDVSTATEVLLAW